MDEILALALIYIGLSAGILGAVFLIHWIAGIF